MTSDELMLLIKSGPTDRLVATLAPLSEAERKKLAKGVVALRKELSRQQKEEERLAWQPPVPCPFCGKMLLSGRAKQCFQCGKNWRESKVDSKGKWDRTSEARLKLAVLAVAPWTEGQRFRTWHVAGFNNAPILREHLFQVLSDRKPAWLARWVDKDLEDETFADWEFDRSLIRAGLCPKPQGQAYILRMINGFRNHDNTQSLRDKLLADPDLLSDEIWRIFELNPVRGTILNVGDITYVPPGPVNRPCFSWAKTLLALAAEGKLDRQRLLSASLGSLLKNTEARNTGWFAKFHEMLKPRVEEREPLQPLYLQLLSHPVPAVVGMALDALGRLDKARRLDAGKFVDGVAAVFHLRPKAQPLAAVVILRRLTAHQQTPASTIAAVLLAGLAHPDVQVQQALVNLLGQLNEEGTDVISAELPGILRSLAPSVKEQASKLVREVVGQPESSACLPDMVGEARRIPSPWREQAGVDGILQLLEGAGDLTAVAFDPMAVPRLDPAQRLQPIETLDELIERLTTAVETLDDPIEFELLLDGLSRLCDQRPADFEAHTAPLLQRSETLMFQGYLPAMTAIGLRSALFKLVRHWGGRDAPKRAEERDSIIGFLDARLDILLARLQAKQASPLLACPTHRPGWVDTREMLRRLQWHELHGMEPSTHDFIQGCLRLVPDRRAHVLAEAGGLQGRFAAAFRYALGGPLEDASLPPAILVAAGRARAPVASHGDLSSPDALAGPDAAEPARYFWDASELGAQAPGFCPNCGKRLKSPEASQCGACAAAWQSRPQDAEASAQPWILPKALLQVGVLPGTPAPEQMRDMPTVLMHAWVIPEETAWSMGAATGVLRWLGTLWPARLDSFFAIGIRLRRVPYMAASLYRLRAAFLAPLFDPDVPFTELAQLLVTLALGQAEPHVAGLAVDALIELIRDGRCVGPEVGGGVRLLMNEDMLKLNRLAKQLETVARASSLHAHVCARIVQTALGGLARSPKDLHYLLTPLLEWLTDLKQGVADDCRPVLAQATTGKTGTLAKRLLQMTSVPERERRYLFEALEGRVERARRWIGLVRVSPL